MKKFVFTFVAICLFQQVAICQEEAPVKKFKLEDISIKANLRYDNPQSGTFIDFQKLTKNSPLLENYDSSIKSLSPIYSFMFPNLNSSSTPYLTLALGIKLNPSKNSFLKSPTLRFELGTYKQQNLYYQSFIDTKFSPQTLQSISNPTSFYFIDSVNTVGLNMNQYSQMINLSTSINFRTKTDKRFSLYTGVGLSLSASYKSQTEITKHNDYGVEFVNSNNQSTSFSGVGQFSTQTIKNKNNFSTTVFIPLGVEMRLSKEKKFFKHTRVFFEMKHGLSYTTMPDLGRSITKYSLTQGVGVRYSF